MILDEIQEAYFKHRYDNVIGVKLKLMVDINTWINSDVL